MLDKALLELCLLRGYQCIPLAKDTKRPLTKWSGLREQGRPALELLQPFLHYHEADIGIVTGKTSGVIVLDFDAPPFIDGDYTETPSGGRHYFYQYNTGDRHGLGIRPKLDIPWIVKVYAEPNINPGRIPIQPKARIERPSPEHGFTEPEGKPSYNALKECAFVEWFREKRENPNWGGRYPLARAYASNAARCEGADLSLGKNYRHEAQIYNNLGHPIRCATIVEQGFKCPFFDIWNESCRKHFGVTTPYGLAKKVSSCN